MPPAIQRMIAITVEGSAMSSELDLQTVIAMALGLYLLFESVTAILQITRDDGSLHISKYMFTALVGMWMCVNAYLGEIGWLVIAQGAALSSFVAHRLLWRFGDPEKYREAKK